MKVTPTTSEPAASEAEIELMQAMHKYKQMSGRNFPTWCEVLEVLGELGYRKESPAPPADTKGRP